MQILRQYNFEGSKKAFIAAAKRKKLFVLLASNDNYIDTKRTKAFLEKNCPAAALEVVGSVHELPITRPQFCYEKLIEIEKKLQ